MTRPDYPDTPLTRRLLDAGVRPSSVGAELQFLVETLQHVHGDLTPVSWTSGYPPMVRDPLVSDEDVEALVLGSTESNGS